MRPCTRSPQGHGRTTSAYVRCEWVSIFLQRIVNCRIDCALAAVVPLVLAMIPEMQGKCKNPSLSHLASHSTSACSRLPVRSATAASWSTLVTLVRAGCRGRQGPACSRARKPAPWGKKSPPDLLLCCSRFTPTLLLFFFAPPWLPQRRWLCGRAHRRSWRGDSCRKARATRWEAAKKRVLELKRKLQTVNDSLAKVDAARERFNTEYENCYGLKCTQLERFQISGSFLPRDYDLTSTDSLIPLYDGPLKNELIRHFVTAVDKQLSNHPRNKGVLNKPKCQRPIYKVVNVYKANPPAALVQQFNAYCSARSATLAQDIVPYVMNHPRKCGKGQFLLYHGCDWNVVDEIIQGGFHKEMSAMNRKCLFGKKLYFADLSSRAAATCALTLARIRASESSV